MRKHRFGSSVKFRRGRRAILLVLLLLAGLLGVTTARAQFQTHSSAATAGGACTTGDFAFPDPSGYALKCVASVWTIVNQPAAAAGSTGQVQFNSSGVLGASSNLFWDNTLFRLGIGTTSPQYPLDMTVASGSGININASSGQADLYLGQAGTQNGGLNAQGGGGTDIVLMSKRFVNIGAPPAGPSFSNSAIYFNTGQVNRGIIDSSGNFGIGTASPAASLDLSQRTDALALPVGTQGQEPASPMNGMIRYSTTANDVEAYVAGAWTTLTTGGSAASITLGTSAATPNPASSFSATTGLFSGASGQVSVTSTGGEIARFTGTGASIGTSYVSTAAPTNGMIVQGNVGIGSSAPAATLDIGSGDVRLSNAGQLLFANTNWYGNTGLYYGGTNSFGFNYWNGSVSTRTMTLSSANVGIGTTSPDALLSLGGQSAQTIDMVRETTASTAGNNLTVKAGGAVPSGTDLAGGNLVLSSGISTGTGSSGINFNIYKAAGSSGSADNSATTAMTVTGAGNVGIGTTTPVALFTVQTGNVAPSSSGNAVNGILVSGSAGGPSLNIGVNGVGVSGQQYGWLQTAYTNSAGTFGYVVLNPLGGNVGIGTTSPQNKLDVNGGVAVGTYAGIAAPSNALIASGSVGIGTTLPLQALDVNGMIAADGTAAITSNPPTVGTAGSGWKIGLWSNGTALGVANYTLVAKTAQWLSIFNGNPANNGTSTTPDTNAAVSFNAGNGNGLFSGNVGIGTTAPYVSLDLHSKTDALALPVGTQGQEPATPLNGMIRYSTTANDVEAYISGAWTTLTTGGSGASITLGTSAATPNPASSYSTTTGEFSPASGAYAISSAGTEKMRVNATGVGIGTTSPSNTLDVNGGVAVGTYAGIAGSSNGIISSGNVGIGTTAPAYLLHVGSPSAVGVVADFQNSSGYCTFNPSANGILTTCTSDVRLKKDITDAGDALEWLGTMRIRDFTLKATGERRTGVIAQEMMKVHPEMVRMGATGFYQVDVPDAWKLIKAIQELKAENDNLVTRIGAEDDALKAANDNIADLRASFEAYKAAHP